MAWPFLYKHTLDVVGKPCLRGKFQELWWVSPIRADGHWFNRAVARTHVGGHRSAGCYTTVSCQADPKSELICFHQQSWLSNLETEYFRGRVIVWLNVREPNNCKRDTYWRVECFLSFSQQLWSSLHTLPWSSCSLQIGSAVSFFTFLLPWLSVSQCMYLYVRVFRFQKLDPLDCVLVLLWSKGAASCVSSCMRGAILPFQLLQRWGEQGTWILILHHGNDPWVLAVKDLSRSDCVPILVWAGFWDIVGQKLEYFL